MNDINEMPPKCQYCPYWEVCEYPWVCPDREQLATNLQQTCNQLATDTISRQAAIEAIKEDKIDLTNPNVVAVFKATGDFEKVETQVMTCDRHIKILKDLLSEQPEIIRCRDCKHWREDHTCGEHSLVSPMMAYEFCSRAERREDSNESKERP